MSYTPHEWVSGETVTASKLNHIEEGIGNSNGGILIVTDTNGTLSHTWQELYDIINNGEMVFLKIVGDYDSSHNLTGLSIYPLRSIYIYNNIYNISFDSMSYSCPSPDYYPSFNEDSIK